MKKLPTLLERVNRMMNRFNPLTRWHGAPGVRAGGAQVRVLHAERGDEQKPDSTQPPAEPPSPPRPSGSTQGPPDLDELWRDFNSRLGSLFGGHKAPRRGGNGNGGGGRKGGSGHGFHPDPKGARIGIGVIVLGAVGLWLASGFFMVHEGDRGVVTTFGRFDSVRGPGLNWRMPYPIQNDEVVRFSQIRSVDVGGDTVVKSTGLLESGMLTEDENIVEVKFAVQYRLNNARDYLFDTRDPDAAVVQVAESAVREVVGKMSMDTALQEERDQIGPRVRQQMQHVLDEYRTGIDIVAVNMQQGGVRPPEQVQDAFDDVLKAGQEAERIRNEAQAYANNVVPQARGAAARLTQEAEGYKARVTAQAEGDAQRFLSILPEYEKAPKVTRDRMYIDTMREVYSGANKIVVDGRAGGNLLYLPLDKVMEGAGAAQASKTVPATTVPNPSTTPTTSHGTSVPASTSRGSETRFRDPAAARSRPSDFR